MQNITEADFAGPDTARNLAAPAGMEWCGWSKQYVRIGMAVGCD